jgi:hypothetical protein
MAKANKTTMDAEIQAFAQDVRQSIAQARQGEAAHVHTPADIARYKVQDMHKKDAVFMTNQTAKQAIPKFKTEAQERAYWESHDSTVHLDWSQAQKVRLPNLRPPRPPAP